MNANLIHINEFNALKTYFFSLTYAYAEFELELWSVELLTACVALTFNKLSSDNGE